MNDRLKGLFTVEDIQQNENKLIATVSLDANHEVFQGHFPNQPITPGVVQVYMVKVVLQQFFNASISLQTLNRCKFIAILNPRETPDITLHLTWSDTDGAMKVSASGSGGEHTFFKFNGTYIKE